MLLFGLFKSNLLLHHCIIMLLPIFENCDKGYTCMWISTLYVQLLPCCRVSHMLVFCQFKLSLKFIIAYCVLEFFPAENVKFHNFTLISIHINLHSNQDRLSC